MVDWNRGPLGAKSSYPLNDPRTRLIQGDVAEVLKSQNAAYDAIMLDVDNGPEGFTHTDNTSLYSMESLQASQLVI